MRSLFISLLFVLFSLFSSAQDNSYRNNNYKWDDDQPKRLSVMSEYINEPAVILDEKTNIEILEDKFFEHFRFNYYIEKTLRIRYQSNKGITQYSKFSLPESFDPAASNYGLTLEEQKHMHRPKGDFDVIVNFAARIIKPDGSIVKAEISDSSEVEKFYIYPSDKNFVNENNSFSARLNGEYQSFPEQKHFAVHFTIKNLQVDDELEVHYIVKHVFMPSRIFFNGTLPKQSYDLNLKSSNRGHIYFVNQFNGAVFKDSLREGNFFKYHWHLSNIAGCLAEKGARNYMELPYISIHLNKLDFGTLDDKGNFKNALPYTWASALLYFVAADAPLSKDLLNNPMNKVNIQLRKWIDEKTTGIPDSNVIQKARQLHIDITDNFDYQNDDDYFMNKNNGNEKLGDFLEDRKLREISRFRLYTRMFERIKVPYYKTLLLDKRVEQMSYDHFETPTTFKISYCIPYKNNAIFIHPKESRFGYYDNEMPFYYEDITTMLIPQNLSLEETYKKIPVVNYINIKTPFSETNDNSRTTNVMVSFHPDTGIVSFATKVDLKGQYSTMTRGSYLYDYFDKYSNPIYHQLVWQLQDDVKKPTINITKQENKYPFEFAFRANYSSQKVLLKDKNGSYFLTLNNWFPHLTDSALNGDNRKLSYFTDFTGNDTYRYYIKCGKVVTLKNAGEFEKNIDNNSGTYFCRLSQPQPDVIMIESSLKIKEEKVIPTEVKGLEEIYNAARKLNSGFLELEFN